MATMKQILFRLGEEEYGVDILRVDAIERKMPILRVPTAPRHIAGLIQLRGEAIPVYDLRARFGMPQQKADVLIIARVEGLKIALAVDSVSEILETEEREVMAAPSLVRSQDTTFISRVTNTKGHMFLMLDLDGLLLPEEKREIERMLRDQMRQKEAEEERKRKEEQKRREDEKKAQEEAGRAAGTGGL